MSYLTPLGRFEPKVFSTKSKTFLIFILICLFLSSGGMFLLISLPLAFLTFNILNPGFYKTIMRKLMVFANHMIFRILSFIPRIDFNGLWFQPLNPKSSDLDNMNSLKSFIMKNMAEISTIHLIFLSWGLQFQFTTDTAFNVFYGIKSSQLLFACFILPVFTGFYFTIIWTIKDMGLKLYRFKESSDNKSREFEEISDLHNSFKSLFGFIFGIPSIFYIFNFANNDASILSISLPELPDLLNIFIILILLYLSTIGVTLFSVIYYYKSDKHTFVVNETREWIRYVSEEINSVNVTVPQHQVNQLKTLPNIVSNEHKTSTIERSEPLSYASEAMAKTPEIENQKKKASFCMSCGEKLQENQKFCIKCGWRINE